MLKKQADHVAQLLPQADGSYLERRYCENVREIYQFLSTASLATFNYSRIDSLSAELNEILHALERLPEGVFKDLIQVIDSLSEARNELRLARFLFDVEEINAVYRLMMRNRSVLRARDILQKTLRVWPLS